ncbi:hypothetical protein HZC34_04640 [Candidatus Saganbacteria bacterium]|nr:hypothetical protein [Candidatus Saganbacteria bacterium]
MEVGGIKNPIVLYKTGGNITIGPNDKYVSPDPKVRLADVDKKIDQAGQSETFANILLNKFIEVV